MKAVKALVLSAIAVVLTATAPVDVANAMLRSEYERLNDVLFYNPNFMPCGADGAAGAGAGAGAPVAPIGGPLPAATMAQIESQDIAGKVAQNLERYQFAEQQTGVPWQMIAAIHYREATLNPRMSIAAGQPLRNGLSIDGVPMSADPNEDARLAAVHLIEMAQMVYKIDIKTDRTVEGIANAFLAYNRGFLYVRAGATYNTSPYVMNGYDDAHMNMSWGPGDTVSGRDSNLGALTIYSFLVSNSGGITAPGAGAGAQCDAQGSGRVASGDCSATGPVTGTRGSGGNGHQLTRAELTALYGEPGSQQGGDLADVDFMGHNVQIHAKLAGCLQAVVDEITANNIQYNITEIGGWRTGVGGGSVANGSSYHQYGAAVDINWSRNPCCSVASYDMPQGYIQAFQNHGWSWGGNWNSIKDYMHFEYNGPPIN